MGYYFAVSSDMKKLGFCSLSLSALKTIKLNSFIIVYMINCCKSLHSFNILMSTLIRGLLSLFDHGANPHTGRHYEETHGRPDLPRRTCQNLSDHNVNLADINADGCTVEKNLTITGLQ